MKGQEFNGWIYNTESKGELKPLKWKRMIDGIYAVDTDGRINAIKTVVTYQGETTYALYIEKESNMKGSIENGYLEHDNFEWGNTYSTQRDAKFWVTYECN